ncbi:ATP-binding cassette domain-containing protein [Aquimonas sp.]|jgi:ABC-type multidrug transport system fused ATPase/permease subunit|uniref:ATP-binding cassette domain-containing protein n=1 Tax=Aquimonas sp. TaxID=1872588 RepID=UPI0037C0B250
MNSEEAKLGRRVSPVLLLYRELWRQAHGNRAALLGSMLLLIGAQVVLLLIPYLLGNAFNILQARGGDGAGDAALWLIAVLSAALASWLMHAPGRILERNVALAVRARVSTTLTERLFSFPLIWHERNHSVGTAHRVQQSSEALGLFAENQFAYVSSAVRLVGPVAALFFIHPLVGGMAALGLIVISWSVVGFDRVIVRLAIRTNDANRRYGSVLADALGSATTVLALRQARPFVRLLGQLLEVLFEPLKRMILINEGKWFVVDMASRLLSCCLVGLYAWLVLRLSHGGQALMLGNVYMVWEYAVQAGAVVVAVASNFQQFAEHYANYQSADPIRAALVDDKLNKPLVLQTWDRCEVQGVVFHHGGARDEAPALDHIRVSLERGKRYALIGKSGSGKSTLMRVLAGLYVAEQIVVQPANCTVVMTPLDAARFLRGSTTMIPQDAELFEGSLGENLAMCESLQGAPAAEEFPHALGLAMVTEFVDSEGDLLQAQIAENGANWSGGQRARLVLARGILAARGSSLVLLDEPTASLDARTEAIVYQNLFAEFAETCLVASVHRLELLRYFDEVLVMCDGRLVAQGPEMVLAETSPEYGELRASTLQRGGGEE